uniref:Uncharacterized protein n=1 Tax=Panagrellus redivivus TaxID=6233 RepID=A0A7E4ZTQ7_PANRE
MVIDMSIVVLTMVWLLPIIMLTSLCCVRRKVHKPTTTPASGGPLGNSATSRRGSRSRRNVATDDPSGSSLMDKDRLQKKSSLTQASSQPSSGGPIAGIGQNSKLHPPVSKEKRKNNRTLDKDDEKEPSAHREESAKEEKLKVEGTIIFTLDENVGQTRRNEDDDDILKSTLDSYEKPTEKRTKTTQPTEDLALERTQESTTLKQGGKSFRAKRSLSAPVHPSPSESPVTMRKGACTK